MIFVKRLGKIRIEHKGSFAYPTIRDIIPTAAKKTWLCSEYEIYTIFQKNWRKNSHVTRQDLTSIIHFTY